MEFNAEQMQELVDAFRAANVKLQEMVTELTTAKQAIAEQAALIKRLSEDNLKLVAELDEVTGKKAPGSIHSA